MLRLNLMRERSQLGRLGQRVASSSQLDVLFGFRADGPGQGQWRAVRSGHEAMGCWVLVQGRGAKSRVLGEWCWLMSDPKPSRFRRMAASGRGVQSLTD
ncbi:hypothetical protein F2Q70_00011423 [Brassica cretica]|uniref:Uncharacterized protein n=1 Tax=Brassica cretica TaxID=69181 RepID=A0A8S9JFX0_BRACR|nr:hypothetical protein F2Q68_00004541 [Brassica cretica]KAF2611523.1 hypothetical protein F2Q70_00011423 [Brassica cretica]